MVPLSEVKEQVSPPMTRRTLALTAILGLAMAIALLPIGWRAARRVLQWPEHRFLQEWSAAYRAAAPDAPTGANPGSPPSAQPPFDALAAAAVERASADVRYDPAYVAIDYPGGDVPPDRGVCTDLVVRAYRDIGVDLQRLVHEDMTAAFGAYPAIWGADRADANIDHRRVPNLMVYFKRQGGTVPITTDPADYRPGDVVTWHLGGGLTHVGIVAGTPVAGTDRPLVAHHVGGRPSVDDVLFAWEIIGHFRWAGPAGR